MRLHEIKQTHARRTSKRLGRGNGSGKGTYSGKGVKGQKARTGANSNIPRTFIGGSTTLMQRLPKLKGFRSSATKATTVNVARLSQYFKDGEKISITTLVEKGLISVNEAKQGVKVVGSSGETAAKFVYDTESGKLSVSKKLLA